MKRNILSAVILILASSPALAENFQSSVDMSYFQYDSGSNEGGSSSLGLAVYAEGVSISNGPLELAGFLSKSSSVTTAYSFSGWSNGDSSSNNDDSYHLAGNYVTEQSMTLGVSYSDYDAGSSHSFTVGSYLDDLTAVNVTFSGNDEDTFTGVSASMFALNELLSGDKVSYGFGVSHADTGDSNFGLSANSTYYINNRLGIGADLGYFYNDNFNILGAGARISYFLNSNVALSTGISFSKISVDDDVLLIGSTTSRSGFVAITSRF